MRNKRTPVMLALAGLIASLMTFVSSGTAVAAESLPDMQWTPVQAEAYRYPLTTSPQGDVTIGCGSVVSDYPQDVVTWGTSGAETRHLPRTPQVDGKDNCIDRPVVDKNGDLYGGLKSGYLYGYDSNTLKWKYSTSCTYYLPRPVIGADGNVYFINSSRRLIGLTPDVQPPLTTPAKVLDVATSNGRCNDQLQAYKDGLRRIDYNGMATYHTYDGTYLGSSNTNTDHAPINAAGRLFSPIFTGSGDNRGVEISAYDPITKKVAWTAQEPMSFYRTYPTPDGGAVVYGERMKVVNGAPTSERVRALVKLSASGIKMWDKDLPNTDTSGVDTAGNNHITVDTTGKLVLVRDWTKQLTGYPWKVPFITIDVLNVATGEAISSPKVMSGNTASSEGEVYGYKVVDSPAIGPNTVYVPAQKCSRYCYGDGETKIYPIKVSGLGLDYPRGAVLNGPAPQKYVALGDSFSSGEGVAPFEDGTDVQDGNQCHRSIFAYSRLVSADPSVSASLGTDGFVACSGAKTEHVKDIPFNGELKQISRLNDQTKFVSLTIGGNDMGFSDFGKACVVDSCDFQTSAYTTALGKINNELPSKLEDTYKKILDATAVGNAKVYVLDYPQVAPDKTITDPSDPGCLYLHDDSSITGDTRPWEDARAARDIVTKLNGKIHDVVENVRAQNADYHDRLVYVPVNNPGSPWEGHTVCAETGQSYFFNIDQFPINDRYIFHPNGKGQAARAGGFFIFGFIIVGE